MYNVIAEWCVIYTLGIWSAVKGLMVSVEKDRTAHVKWSIDVRCCLRFVAGT